ncbi:hypothetical protein K503DRAFT_545306 [Rhizopogon vinicolor AM-OR11-026]|uniref:RhoGEF-domain-containing protein n=1 Tax=Rhizopogon vinicolor AM-OR11-026 TaxID=1314800 RepID=A0A1B7NH91_9AGAM|nr:hypothetical protein K503DRAFT_545306 [Rhizopogon vinicolor AM-OR11-026]
MANVPGRKKSIAANPGLIIETPVANNNILNKAASQSTSLYQQCSSLRSRLMRIPDFSNFFILSSQSGSLRQSTDPVTQLWDCFSLGISLCFLYELLPGRTNPPTVKTDPAVFDVSNERAKKHAIAVFVMNIKNLDNCEQFTVTDLWERHSTDGLVKVVNTVTTIVDMLPSELFDPAPLSPLLMSTHDSIDSLIGDVPSTPVPTNAQEAARNNIIRELVETERKYVQDLEIMQKYATALSQSNTIDLDTIHYLFPGLNKLLNFQRKFLIRLESTAEMPWKDQRWGLLFQDNEEDFAVYEPYCANYTHAVDLMLAEEQNLSVHNKLICAKSELPAFLIKPVQRICKYPLLLDSLIKATSTTDYPHFEELQSGSAAAKRITDKINEAQRRAENVQTVKNLEGRVQDWKGHHLSNFGSLLLDDIFTVTKSDVDREYHVFLFEKIILCCKEAVPPPQNVKRGGKNNSILKKQNGAQMPAPPPMTSPNKRKDTPLLLKGRIFLNNVTQAIPSSSRNSIVNPYSLAVWWRGDDDLEFFTLRCRSEEQLRQWENQINRLIKEVASRRASERNFSQLMAQHSSHASVPAMPVPRPPPYIHDRASSSMSHAQATHSLPPHPASGLYRVNAYGTTEEVGSASVSYSSGPPGYPLIEGFEFDLEDEYEDYPPASLPPSGRGTPIGVHRMQSMPVEPRDSSGYDRPRARTEDINGQVMSQWRSTNGVAPLPPGAGPAIPPSYRPMASRMNSSASGASFGMDPNFRTSGRPLRVPLHSQVSSSKLKTLYDNGGTRSVTASPAMNGSTAPPLTRSRSASQPSAYIPQPPPPPPVPSNTMWPHRTQDSVTSSSKRGSGSSQSTGGGSSEESPHSSSPITPFGSSESSLPGSALRPSRSQTFETMTANGAHLAFSPPVKVKVHFNEDIFVIQVPRCTEYCDLVDKVGRKIRLCGPRRDDTPLRVRYQDEDGDMVSLGSTEDVQMAFESFRPGGQVTLYVT